VGIFGKLFGKQPQADTVAPVEPEAPDWPDAVVVLRRGMNMPDAGYVAKVVAASCDGLPEAVPRIGLSQPSWFKNEEGADHIAQGVVETFASQLGLGEVSSRRHLVDGPDGCACLVVELRRLG
jgi:hypothetical protein